MPLSQAFFWIVPIVALCSYCMLMLFFFMSQKDQHIKLFMLVLGALMIWTASSLLMKLDISPGGLFWSQMMVAGMITVTFFLYIFVANFTNTFTISRSIKWALLSVATLVVNFMGLIMTNVEVVKNEVTINGFQYLATDLNYTLGPLALPMYVFMFALVIAILGISKRYADEQGNAKNGQIRLVAAGALIMALGVLFNFIPAIGKYPVDILGCFINAILITIAIFKNRMLELRFIATRAIVYSLLALLITAGYVLVVLNAERYWAVQSPFLTIFLALLIAVIFQPLYRLSGSLVDRLFYKSDYSRRQALRNFSVSISNNLDLDNIAKELIEAVQNALHSRDVLIMLQDKDKVNYSVFATSSQLFKPDFQIKIENPMVKWFLTNDAGLSRREMYSQNMFKAMWEKERKELSDLNVDVIVPIKSRNNLIGMLMLTRKRNNTAYNLDDLDLLTYLGASSAVAIDNARLFAQAQAEAITDSLTQVYNHRYFHKALNEQVEILGSAELSLLMIDLDLFKLFNDLYGQYEGDRALVEVASIIKTIVGSNGIVCRYSGEEFAVLLPRYDSNRAYQVAEKIRIEIQRRFFNMNDVTQRFLTASVGVCTYPHVAANARELLQRADLAIYTAKNNGKNQTVVYTPSAEGDNDSQHLGSSKIVEKSANTATIYALTAAIDAKDRYTFGHSQRVADYVSVLSSGVGLDKTHRSIIRDAALLHDIGKIGIPENILTKTGILSEEERDIVNRHVEMSITIIKHLPSLNYVIPAVLAHHERWDGKGYPRGLAGENIPLSGRCLAIADAFDAMTSNRPYRHNLHINIALNEIEKGRGTQFDPLLANLFIRMVRDGTIDVERIMNTSRYAEASSMRAYY